VKDTSIRTVLLRGPSENGLYPIPFHLFVKQKPKRVAAFLGVKTTNMVWHQRLVHPSAAVFSCVMSHQHLPLAGSFDRTRVCELCQLGKSKQLSFFESSRQSSSPLELIHSDVWLSLVSSLTGCRFYVIFVDDYNRFTWLVPLVSKSQVFSSFVKFKLLVEKQFNTSIKQFQSDNGGEYTSNQFKQYLNQHGILHRLTCPYTSQQNGIAERKHRHIVELGLTLLAQSGLSSKHWVDSFLTSVYLINRLPTPILKNESPYFKLFEKDLDYTTLRTFGCLCYPLLRLYIAHKLSFRSKPCIFLGYGANQKGYRCFDPHSQRIYISRHVVFDESKFSTKNMTISHDPCKRTVTPSTSLITLPPSSPTNQTLESSATNPPSHNQSPAIPDPRQLTNQSLVIPDSLTQQLPLTILLSSLNSQSTELHQPTSNPSSPDSSTELLPPNTLPTHTFEEAHPLNTIITRSQTGNLKPKTFPDFKMFHTS
jgi:hypothetical protein